MTFYDNLLADADRDTRTLVHVDRADDRAVVTRERPTYGVGSARSSARSRG
jgi:hypothetical protein